MNQLLLTPSDVLFFRDGRPMGGSLAGHGAAWPLPTVTNAALHAAMHRAQIGGVHSHDQIRLKKGGQRDRIRKDDRKFGCLVTAGPFPVVGDDWFFPRPLDAASGGLTDPTFLPLAKGVNRDNSSLPYPLQYAVANAKEPSKDSVAPWWNKAAWRSYLGLSPGAPPCFKSDSDFSDTEFNFGIGIDPATDTQDGERFYSAHYLRLREGCHLGLLASAHDKLNNGPGKRDLIHKLFPNHGTSTPIIIGGQQRACSVRRHENQSLPLPCGKTAGFASNGDQTLVKWVLLTPAIFPIINDHTGGWLPSWIDMQGQVQLLDGPGKNFSARHHLAPGKAIPAKLVAAMVGKPIPVTGYACDNGLEDRKEGPKPTYLAVPAGSVYYFQCAPGDAARLAAALNWHGSDPNPTTIKNRRSTLLGEKGFGLGVCGTWQFYS